MNVRAKFKVQSVTKDESQGETIRLSAVTGEGNESWSKYTPSGQLEMRVTNEAIFGAFLPGQCVYIDFTPADLDSD